MIELPQPKTPSLFSNAAFDVVAIAGSFGGLEALQQILASLPSYFPAAILIVLHRTTQQPNHQVEVLSWSSRLPVRQAVTGEQLQPGTVYVAVPGQHLLIAPGGIITQSLGPKVCHVRPSANPLFESIGRVFKERAIGLILSGLLNDGAAGVSFLKRIGGRVIVQDRRSSRAFGMPQAAIATGCVDFVLPLSRIAPALVTLVMIPGAAELFRVPSSPESARFFGDYILP